ncbi:EamA family transporter [Candidatus Falkowbacteria bacterium]|nr:EamA family transporter [Candidatus Falkowbacteria bacterium]
MLWLILISLAILIFAVENILDKFIVDKELKDPLLLTTVFGLVLYIFYVIFASVSGSILLPIGLAFWGIIAGLATTAGVALYYFVMQKEEVSTFITILAIEPLVVASASFFLFQERLNILNYAGILSIIAGVILLSHEKRKTTVKNHLLALTFLTITLFSVRNLIFKYAANEGAGNAVFFWFGLGGLLVSTILLALHHPRIRAKARAGTKHVAIIAVLSAIGLFFFTKAIAIGSVSLTIALFSAKPLVVLILVVGLSSFWPKIVRERLSRLELIKKISAAILIVIGCALIVL